MVFFKAKVLVDNGELDGALRLAENTVSSGKYGETEMQV